METRRTFLLGMLALGLPVRAAAQGFPGGLEDAFGPRFGARANVRDLRLSRPRRGAGVLERVRHWNEVAIDASGLDHTPGRRRAVECSASSWDRAARAARWRSSTSRCSMP